MDNDALRNALELINQQAEDDGLWFSAQTAPESSWAASCALGREKCDCGTPNVCCDNYVEPQAQAGEPEVVAWAMPRKDGLFLDVISPAEHESCEGDYRVPLITLQFHREAMAKFYPAAYNWTVEKFCFMESIAKKDAALKACVEALDAAVQAMDKYKANDGYVAIRIGFSRAAITKAQEALNE